MSDRNLYNQISDEHGEDLLIIEGNPEGPGWGFTMIRQATATHLTRTVYSDSGAYASFEETEKVAQTLRAQPDMFDGIESGKYPHLMWMTV